LRCVLRSNQSPRPNIFQRFALDHFMSRRRDDFSSLVRQRKGPWKPNVATRYRAPATQQLHTGDRSQTFRLDSRSQTLSHVSAWSSTQACEPSRVTPARCFANCLSGKASSGAAAFAVALSTACALLPPLSQTDSAGLRRRVRPFVRPASRC